MSCRIYFITDVALGTRYRRRGIDSTGAVANFVETEQVLILTYGHFNTQMFYNGCMSMFPGVAQPFSSYYLNFFPAI